MDPRRYALRRRSLCSVPLLAGALLLLGACGRPLGDFAVSDVVLVDGTQLKAIDPDGFLYDGRGDMLQIRLLSSTNLAQAAQSVGNIYFDAWDCDDSSRVMWAVGPYYDGLLPTLPTSQSIEERPDGGQTVRITGGGPRQPPRVADGRYRYTFYLALAQPALSGHGLPSHPAYDLRNRPTDVCLRLREVGYWLKAPTSTVFRVDLQRLEAAVAAGKRHGQPTPQ